MHFRLDQVLRASWSGIVDWLIPASSAASDYPNQLAAQGPLSGRVRPVPWLLLGMVAICLIPRALMAWKLDVICTDAIFYIQSAQALENGDFDRAFSTIHLNIFPVVLIVLNRLGLDWELAGKLWGVTMSTLVVLPLFGLARRQFDERVAVAACVLYAVHPKLIEWSPGTDSRADILVSLCVIAVPDMASRCRGPSGLLRCRGTERHTGRVDAFRRRVFAHSFVFLGSMADSRLARSYVDGWHWARWSLSGWDRYCWCW